MDIHVVILGPNISSERLSLSFQKISGTLTGYYIFPHPLLVGVASVPESVGHGTWQYLQQTGVRHFKVAEAAHGCQVCQSV